MLFVIRPFPGSLVPLTQPNYDVILSSRCNVLPGWALLSEACRPCRALAGAKFMCSGFEQSAFILDFHGVVCLRQSRGWFVCIMLIFRSSIFMNRLTLYLF